MTAKLTFDILLHIAFIILVYVLASNFTWWYEDQAMKMISPAVFAIAGAVLLKIHHHLSDSFNNVLEKDKIKAKKINWGVFIGIIILAIVATKNYFATEKELYEQAITAYKNKQYDRSIELLGKVINLNPYNIEAHLKKGEVYITVGDYDKSENDYNAAFKLNGQNIESIKGIGNALSRKEKV